HGEFAHMSAISVATSNNPALADSVLTARHRDTETLLSAVIPCMRFLWIRVLSHETMGYGPAMHTAASISRPNPAETGHRPPATGRVTRPGSGQHRLARAADERHAGSVGQVCGRWRRQYGVVGA